MSTLLPEPGESPWHEKMYAAFMAIEQRLADAEGRLEALEQSP